MSNKRTPARTRKHPDGLTASEDAFVQKAAIKGWSIYRAGWPDFLCHDPETDRFTMVEVKAGSQKLSTEQERMFAALEQMKIDVWVYLAGTDKLISWRKFQYGSNDSIAGQTRARMLLKDRLTSAIVAKQLDTEIKQKMG